MIIKDYIVTFMHIRGDMDKRHNLVESSLKLAQRKEFDSIRSQKGHPVGTLCIISDVKSDQVIHIGKSIRAKDDKWSGIKGKGLALSRALKKLPRCERKVIGDAWRSRV